MSHGILLLCYSLLPLLIDTIVILDLYTFSLQFFHFVIHLEGTTIMSGQLYATLFLSHYIAYAPSMEHYRILLILSR